MNKPINPSRRASGFTLIELLVVMGIIIILVGSVIVAGTTLITRAKVTNTRATLTVVRDAVEQFAREQKTKPTLARRKAYQKRFGFFPPDELEELDNFQVRRGDVVPPATQFPSNPMLFYVSSPTAPETPFEHRDLAAMILAIELFGNESKDILNRITERYRSAGAVDSSGDPSQFLDRNRDGKWDSDDVQIRYIIDDWGTPIGYMAQRDFDPSDPLPSESKNDPDWNQVSTRLIKLNGNQPLIFSYGPDGQQQLTKDAMSTGASLPADFARPIAPDPPDKIDHVFNADNIYVDQTFKEKL